MLQRAIASTNNTKIRDGKNLQGDDVHHYNQNHSPPPLGSLRKRNGLVSRCCWVTQLTSHRLLAMKRAADETFTNGGIEKEAHGNNIDHNPTAILT